MIIFSNFFIILKTNTIGFVCIFFFYKFKEYVNYIFKKFFKFFILQNWPPP
jgi:hypothetical protein